MISEKVNIYTFDSFNASFIYYEVIKNNSERRFYGVEFENMLIRLPGIIYKLSFYLLFDPSQFFSESIKNINNRFIISLIACLKLKKKYRDLLPGINSIIVCNIPSIFTSYYNR